MSKKVLIRRKISLRDMVRLVNYLQTGDKDIDLSEYDNNALNKVELRYLRVTEEERDKGIKFLDEIKPKTSVTVESLLYGVRRTPKQIIESVSDSNIVSTTATPVASDTPAKKRGRPPKNANATNADTNTAVDPVFGQYTRGSDERGTNFPVYSREERAMMLTNMVKEDVSPELLEDGKLRLCFADYPFIPNPNKNITMKNFDVKLCLRMIEESKMSQDEAIHLFDLSGARMLLHKHPNEFSVSMYRPSYEGQVNLFNCLWLAEDHRAHYSDMLEDDKRLTEEDNMKDYLRYFSANAPLCGYEISDNYNESEAKTFAGSIENIKGDTIIFGTKDEDEHETFKVKYKNAEQMKIDILLLNRQYRLKFNDDIDVFGKKTSIHKIVKEFYKKFPRGFNEERRFYDTYKEAYEAEVYDLGGYKKKW